MHIPYTPFNVSQEYRRASINNLRWYISNGIYCIGVTSMLKATESEYKKRAIAKYIEANPHKPAIWELAMQYGTDYHLRIENALKCEKDLSELMFGTYLQEYAFICASELSLIDTSTKIAGTIDCVVKDKQGKYVLLDFKTSMRRKERKHCYDYFQQLGIYSHLCENVLKVEIDRAAILMLIYDIESKQELEVLEFELTNKQLNKYKEKGKQRIDNFYLNYLDF
jgi:hypothetical protein